MERTTGQTWCSHQMPMTWSGATIRCIPAVSTRIREAMMTMRTSTIASKPSMPRVWIACAVVAIIGLAGCGYEKLTVTPLRSPESVMGDVFVSPYASIIAVGGTQQLSVTGETLTGAPMTDFD